MSETNTIDKMEFFILPLFDAGFSLVDTFDWYNDLKMKHYNDSILEKNYHKFKYFFNTGISACLLTLG